MKTSDFYYNLPQELIAQVPLKKRDASRLLVLDKNTGKIEHKHFNEIIDYLDKGDTVVLNNTKVIPARLFGHRENHTGKIEVLLLKQIKKDIWECIVRRANKIKKEIVLVFGDNLKGKVIETKEEGIRVIHFQYEGIWEQILDEIGVVPLPPYITTKLEDKNRYQTIYCKKNGSSAAPTAGLHFTKQLLNKIKQKGINIVYVTLHVGLGTFRPVKVDNIINHKMHSEYYEIDKKTCDIINETKQRGNKIICVGTTSCRVLESASKDDGKLYPNNEETTIFIYPGYKFKIVDNLITNFHLPESTLIMLVSALAGKENIMSAYNEAIKGKYRFFSFGDAMYIK